MRWVGIGAVVLIPMAFLNGIDRFAQLPQVLALHVFALAGVLCWARSGQWRSSPPVLPALALCLLTALSIFSATTPLASVLPLATQLAGVMFFLALMNGLTESDFHMVLTWAGAVAGVLSILGLLQFFGIGRSWVPTAGLPSATLGHRNLAAAYLVGMLPFTAWCWARARGGAAQFLCGAGGGLELAFLLATRSRGAWVGLVVGLLPAAGLLLLTRKPLQRFSSSSRRASAGLAVALAVGVALVPAQIEKGAGEAMWEGKEGLGDAIASVVRPEGDKGRLAMWRHTVDMIASHPIRGVGAGNWRLLYPAYAQGDMAHGRWAPYRPHNDWLWIWAETGTPGFAAYIALLLVGGILGWRLIGQRRDTGLAVALSCSFLGVACCGFFGFSREFPAAWLPFYLALAGFGICMPDATSPLRRFRPALVGAAVLLLLSGWTVVRAIGFDREVLRARIAFALQAWPEVISHVNAALTWGTEDEEVYLMRGRAHAAQGDTPLALADYQAGLHYHPYSQGLWNGLGMAQQALHRSDAALAAFHRALQLDPKSAETFNNLGTLYAAIGQLDSARVAYQNAVQFDAGLIAAYANLSIVLRKQGDWRGARDAAQHALDVDPNHLEALVAKGNALMDGGAFEAAEQAFSQVLATHPQRVELLVSMGRIYEALGRPTDAIGAYRTFLNHWAGGQVPQVQFARSRLHFLTGQ